MCQYPSILLILLGPNKSHLKTHHSEIAGVMQSMTEQEKVPKPRPELLIFLFTNRASNLKPKYINYDWSLVW